MVIGVGGAGKSTFARRFAQVTGLPLIHLDRLFWKPGWVETPRDEWVSTMRQITSQPSWLIDGNYGGTIDIRLEAADTIVFLDVPTRRAIFRVIKRRLVNRRSPRPDMTEGCPERLDLGFLRWIAGYNRTRRPAILARLEGLQDEKLILHLRTDAEVERLLAEAASAVDRSSPGDV